MRYKKLTSLSMSSKLHLMCCSGSGSHILSVLGPLSHAATLLYLWPTVIQLRQGQWVGLLHHRLVEHICEPFHCQHQVYSWIECTVSTNDIERWKIPNCMNHKFLNFIYSLILLSNFTDPLRSGVNVTTVGSAQKKISTWTRCKCSAGIIIPFFLLNRHHYVCLIWRKNWINVNDIADTSESKTEVKAFLRLVAMLPHRVGTARDWHLREDSICKFKSQCLNTF